MGLCHGHLEVWQFICFKRRVWSRPCKQILHLASPAHHRENLPVLCRPTSASTFMPFVNLCFLVACTQLSVTERRSLLDWNVIFSLYYLLNSELQLSRKPSMKTEDMTKRALWSKVRFMTVWKTPGVLLIHLFTGIRLQRRHVALCSWLYSAPGLL